MPIYEYRCAECGEIFERMLRVADYTPTSLCSTEGCSGVGSRIYTPPYFSVDNYDRMGYQPSAGRAFKNRSDFKDYLKESKLVEVGPEDYSKSKERRKLMIEARKAREDASRTK